MKKIFKINFILLTVFVFSIVSADSANITQINFTSSSQTIDTNAISAILTVQTQNAGGTLEQTSETNHLNFSSTSPTGEFSSSNVTWTPVTTLSMSTGTANKNFYYRDSTAGTHTLTISAEGQTWTSATQNITINAVQTETFIIRNGDSVIYNGSVSLPASGTVSINDSANVGHTVNARSVLAVLKNIDDGSDTFAITDLNYNNSFQSFLLNCITPSSSEQACYNWQYVVNESYPDVGMDKNILSGGETIYLYFGPQNKVILSSNSINTNNILTVTAKKYDYQNNTWLTRTGVTVGLTQPDPNNTFSPIEIQTHAVDENGQTTFSGISVGSYDIGVQQDYYFPTESLTVSAMPDGSAGSSGGGGTYVPPTFDVQKALAYLKSVQSPNGSFDNSELYTDWAGIAFGAMNVDDSSRDTLLTYLNSHNTISSTLTDNERRAMVLLSLGKNPYSFNGVNYIDAIVKSFDGTQFGDANLINDDIFALIPLKNSGYTANDDIIIKDIAFIISKQKTDGSFEESADITASAIQMLKSFETVTGASDAILKGADYLKNTQGVDGGWGNVSSTSWVMQAMGALSTSWEKGGFTPNGYLGRQQVSDGAVAPSSETLSNRIWATSYAIVASTLKPWDKIMKTITKPSNGENPLTGFSQNTPNSINDLSGTKKISQTKNKIRSSISPLTNIPETNTSALTATASNSLPAHSSLPTQTIPVVLGFLSGSFITFFVTKFFFYR